MGRDTETQTSCKCKKAKQKFLTVEEASISGKNQRNVDYFGYGGHIEGFRLWVDGGMWERPF